MKNILILLTATIFLILLSSCKKDDTTPTYHKDIFRCKVNGVEWVATCPSDGLFGCEPIDCQYYWKDTKGFEIGAKRRNHDSTIRQSIGWYARPVIIGLNQTIVPARDSYIEMNNISGCRFYTIDTSLSYHLNIVMIDTVNLLIKGDFGFTAINDCQDTMRITDGFFHVNFRF